jgi:hypothetical protein
MKKILRAVIDSETLNCRNSSSVVEMLLNKTVVRLILSVVDVLSVAEILCIVAFHAVQVISKVRGDFFREAGAFGTATITPINISININISISLFFIRLGLKISEFAICYGYELRV